MEGFDNPADLWYSVCEKIAAVRGREGHYEDGKKTKTGLG